MKGIMSVLMITAITGLQAQEQTQTNRNGWVFGTAAGVSAVHLSTTGLTIETQAGLTLDAPAFYDIKAEDERKFYVGPSVLAVTGYEIWRKDRFALDLQVRAHYGYSTIPEGKRTGMAVTTLIGLNWYFHKHE